MQAGMKCDAGWHEVKRVQPVSLLRANRVEGPNTQGVRANLTGCKGQSHRVQGPCKWGLSSELVRCQRPPVRIGAAALIYSSDRPH